ncbi:MAG: hypothetical protein M1480_19385 [Bacteroidetes bacterium]|nr:hypothetical protein [Bacteroidota bacterium]
MNKKKFLIAFVVVFVLLEFTNLLIHNVLLMSAYEANKTAFREMDAMMSKMWVMYVVDFVWSFFFVFFFTKGYENKGIAEGIRYGIYIGLFVSFVAAYAQYVVYPLSYSLILLWFIYGLIQSIILGITAALIYKPAEAPVAQTA